jgi:hypothetical protein
MQGTPSHGKGVIDSVIPHRIVTYARAVASESSVFGLFPYGDMTQTLGAFVGKSLFALFAPIFHNATVRFVTKVDPHEAGQ